MPKTESWNFNELQNRMSGSVERVSENGETPSLRAHVSPLIVAAKAPRSHEKSEIHENTVTTVVSPFVLNAQQDLYGEEPLDHRLTLSDGCELEITTMRNDASHALAGANSPPFRQHQLPPRPEAW